MGPFVRGMPAVVRIEEEVDDVDVDVAVGPRPVGCCFRAMMSKCASRPKAVDERGRVED